MVTSVVDYYRIICEEKNIDLDVYNEVDLSAIVTSDEKRITQILRHLVDNACKYTSTGSISVTMGHFVDDDEKHFLDFVVRDTGAGIPEER